MTDWDYELPLYRPKTVSGWQHRIDIQGRRIRCCQKALKIRGLTPLQRKNLIHFIPRIIRYIKLLETERDNCKNTKP